MSDRTKQILIIFFVVVAVLVGLYYWASPYENCYRKAMDSGATRLASVNVCRMRSTW
ncbi:MAG: hypothetical protein ABGY10_01075 [bacterium]